MRTHGATIKRLLAGLLLVAIVAVPVYSLTVQKATLQELTEESTIIVRGSIDAVNHTWGDQQRGVIHTVLTIRVDEYVKGDGEETLEVRQLGGSMGELNMHIMGTPHYTHGDEAVFFLVYHNNAFWIHSIALGAFTVVNGPQGARVLNNLGGVELQDTATGERLSTEEYTTDMPLDAFLAKVRSYLR